MRVPQGVALGTVGIRCRKAGEPPGFGRLGGFPRKFLTRLTTHLVERLVVAMAAPCNGPLTTTLTIGSAGLIGSVPAPTRSLTKTLTTLSDLSEKGLPDR